MASYDKHLALLTAALHPGEQIVDSVSATVTTSLTSTSGTTSGALAATSERLVFSGSYLFSKDQRSWPWAQVSSMDFQQSMLLAHITVTAATSAGRFLVAKGDRTKRFLDVAQQLMLQSRTPAAVPAVAAPSTVDELAKLAELHRAGALTDDEFATAKARLLG